MAYLSNVQRQLSSDECSRFNPSLTLLSSDHWLQLLHAAHLIQPGHVKNLFFLLVNNLKIHHLFITL